MPPVLRDTSHGHEFFSPLRSSHLHIEPPPKWTRGQDMRQRGQRGVMEQGKKEKGMQAKPSRRSRCPHTLSGLDKPIPSGFALSVTPSSASFFPPCRGRMSQLPTNTEKQAARHQKTRRAWKRGETGPKPRRDFHDGFANRSGWNRQTRTHKVAIATPIMASAISQECLLLLINKQWADSHFGAVYVSWIS